MDPDDLDDILGDGKRADLEARFRELESQAEIDKLRQQSGSKAAQSKGAESTSKGDGGSGSGSDPLSEMKASLDSDQPLERYLMVVCPHCAGKNRMSLSQVRDKNPICGRCKEDLSFTKV